MEPFLGEIKIFAGNFAPYGWALCNGQLIAIAQNTALYSLLGTYYGGDGRSTFALPDFQGRAPMFWGSGGGVTPRVLGERGGTPSVLLMQSQQPPHSHSLNGLPSGRGQGGATQASPAGNAFATPGAPLYVSPAQNNVAMFPLTIVQTGGGQPHNNMQPYQALSFIIALQGIFPRRP